MGEHRLRKKVYDKFFKARVADEVKKILNAQILKTISEKGYDQRLLQVEENLRNVNQFVENSQKSCDEIDYFDFENYFRGPRETVKKWQEDYLPYFQGRQNVLDIGCGRGEFLEVLTKAGVDVTGVDVYPKFVEYCKGLGLRIVQADALDYLHSQEKTGGIFASQVIEHLSTDKMIEFCRLAYQKLEDGAYLIMETPNPSCLAIFTHAFYIDPSHNKPVHPLTVRYILERAGYRDIQIVYTETSRLSEGLPMLQGQGIDNLDEFNQAIKELNNVLYGSQDYAVIAKK